MPKTVFQCGRCGAAAPIEWSPDLIDVTLALAPRPDPQTQNWYPAGHPTAVRCGIPHGQSVRDLWDENTEHGVK